MGRSSVQKQALDLAVNNKRCGLGISMGVGKTRIAIQHLQKNYDPFIRVSLPTIIFVVPFFSGCCVEFEGRLGQ